VFEEQDIPAAMLESVKAHRETMVEAIAETDKELTMKFLEGEEISIPELKAALRKATIDCKVTPVMCGSAYKTRAYR
jgi:elongation factor G